MENPSTWGRAERVVYDAYHEWHDNRDRGIIGLSLVRTITDALRREGLLKDTKDEE